MKVQFDTEGPRRRLGQIRTEIDKIDEEILSLLFRRQSAAIQAGLVKQVLGMDTLDQKRERQVLTRLSAGGNTTLAPGSIRSIFAQIMTASRSVQTATAVAYLGPQGTFTHQAAEKYFGGHSAYRSMDTLEEVFASIANGLCGMGVVPLENSSEGAVRETLDLFNRTNLKIHGEVFLKIEHHLLSRAPGISAVNRVYSHPMALAQCSGWIRENLCHVECLEASSTARAVSLAFQNPAAAAVGSGFAGHLHSLPVLARGIENRKDNRTRFAVLGDAPCPAPTGRDRTSLLVHLDHRPGALCSALDPLAENGINLTRIDSHPSGTRPWEYMFFLDLEGHAKDEAMSQAIGTLASRCSHVKTLGSYPRGDELWT